MFSCVALLWSLYILRLWHTMQDYSTYAKLYDARYTSFRLPAAHYVLHFVLWDHLVGDL